MFDVLVFLGSLTAGWAGVCSLVVVILEDCGVV
jgi:hypothetical protein